MAYSVDRASVVDYTAPVDMEGYTFLVKKTPANEKLTRTSELAVVKGMRFGFKTNGVMHKHFKTTTDKTEQHIFKIATVSGTML